jgi:signal peptidase I
VPAPGAVSLLVFSTVLVLALTVGPRLLPHRAYTIEGGSMEPTIPLGSEAVPRPAEDVSP